MEGFMSNREPLVFIAGPYIGDGTEAVIEANIRQAREVAVKLADFEIPFFCPHTHTAHFQRDAKAPEIFYRELCLRILERAATVLLLLPNWQTSRGTLGEHARAAALGIPIFEDADRLIDAITNRNLASHA
jgi:hypothetical protein